MDISHIKDEKGRKTRLRKDGKGYPEGHDHPQAKAPHAHVPEITNDDGTPWLSIH